MRPTQNVTGAGMIQSERRRLVSFGIPKIWSKDGLLASFRASGKVFAQSGQLNSNHRLLCAFADLFVEQGYEPWATPSVPERDSGFHGLQRHRASRLCDGI